MIARRLALLLALAPVLASAQARPSDDDLFGAPAPAPSPAPDPAGTAAPGAPGTPDARGDDLLGAGRAAPDTRIDERRDNPLAVGGLAYLRAAATWNRGAAPADWPLSSPNLLDAFLDARPNDRVRAFALGRLSYDPTRAATGTTLLGTPVAQAQTTAVLDQLYLNFDLDRTVFVTAGKQHVKWGTGKLWNPGDFLHPVRRDPLAQFDARTGVTMVKVHLPWERRGWNLYGVALLEDLGGATGGTGTVGRVGGAARAEVVVGGAELGFSAAAQRGHRPRVGVDGSVAVLDLDLHAEAVLTAGRDAPRWVVKPGGDPATLDGWTRTSWDRLTPQVVAGAEWSWKYSDEDALVLGAEVFWNDAGYGTARAYPLLLSSPFRPVVDGNADTRAAFAPFYLGRRYAGAYLSVPRPGRWNDTTFTLSAIANASDGSGVVRLDHAVVLNTYLTLETYLAGHLGHEGGEFRFGVTVPPQPPLTLGTVVIPTPVLDAGVALRVKL